MATSKTPTGKKTGSIYSGNIGSLLKTGKFNALASSLPLLANGGTPFSAAAKQQQPEGPPDYNQRLLEIAESINGGGYDEAGGSPIPISQGGATIAEPSGTGTSGSGFTLGVVLKALQDQGLADKMTAKDLKDLQKAWSSDKATGKNAKQAAAIRALEKFKLGREVAQEEAKPGDIVQIKRKDGSEQTAIFKEWVTDAQGEKVGIKYRSSQETTKGVGDNIEYFNKGAGINPEDLQIARIGETPSEAAPPQATPPAPPPEASPSQAPPAETPAAQGTAQSAPSQPTAPTPEANPAQQYAAGGIIDMVPTILGMLQRNNLTPGAPAAPAAPPPPAAAATPGSSDIGAGAVESALTQLQQDKKQSYMDTASSITNIAGSMLGTAGAAAAYGPDGRVNPTMTAMTGAASGMTMGADLGKVFGPWGMAGGAALGALVGGGAGFVTGKDKEAKFLQNKMNQELARVRNAAVRPTAYQKGGPAMQGGKAKPIQAEVGEEFLTPDLQIAPTKATKKHFEMAPGEITDVVPNGTYIFSDQLQFRPFDIADKVVARGVSYFSETENYPTHMSKFLDVLGDSKTPMTFAEAARVIKKKFPVVNDTSDPLSQVTDLENKQTRMAFLAKLVELQQRRNGADQPLPEFGGTPQFAEGGCAPGQRWDAQLNKCVPDTTTSAQSTTTPPAIPPVAAPTTPAENPSVTAPTVPTETAPAAAPTAPPATTTTPPPADTATTPATAPQQPAPDATATPGQPAAPEQAPPAAGATTPAESAIPAPKRRSDLIGDLTGRYKKIYEDFLKINDAQNAQSSKDYKRLYGELGAMNAASTLNNVLGTMGQDTNVTPAFAGSTLADAIFAPTPETRIAGITDQFKTSRDNIVRDMIAAGVPPGQAAIMAAGVINDTMKQEGDMRAQFAERQTELDRQKYSFLQTVRDTNEKARVDAENQSRDLANQKIAQITDNIQQGLNNAGELRKAALETRRALFREKMSNYYDTVNKQLGTEMEGTKAKIWQDYYDDVQTGIEKEREARLKMLEDAKKKQDEQNAAPSTVPTEAPPQPPASLTPQQVEAKVNENLTADQEAATIMQDIQATETQLSDARSRVASDEASLGKIAEEMTAIKQEYATTCGGGDIEADVTDPNATFGGNATKCNELRAKFKETADRYVQAENNRATHQDEADKLKTRYDELDGKYKQKAQAERDKLNQPLTAAATNTSATNNPPAAGDTTATTTTTTTTGEAPTVAGITTSSTTANTEIQAAEQEVQNTAAARDSAEAEMQRLQQELSQIVDQRDATCNNDGSPIVAAGGTASQCEELAARYDKAFAEFNKALDERNKNITANREAKFKLDNLKAEAEKKKSGGTGIKSEPLDNSTEAKAAEGNKKAEATIEAKAKADNAEVAAAPKNVSAPAEAKSAPEEAGSFKMPSDITTRDLMDEAIQYAGDDPIGLATQDALRKGKSAGKCGRGTKSLIGALVGGVFAEKGPLGGDAYEFGMKGTKGLHGSGLYEKKQAMPNNYLNDPSQWRVGDVIASGGGKDGIGHIQVWTGTEWVSDFPQGKKILQKRSTGEAYTDFALHRLNAAGVEALKKKHGKRGGGGNAAPAKTTPPAQTAKPTSPQRDSTANKPATPEARGIKSEPITTGTYKSSINSKAPTVSRILSSKESGDSYKKLYNNAEGAGREFAGVDVTNMTIGELTEFTSPRGKYGQWARKTQGKDYGTPLGRYQFVGTTMAGVAREMGLPPNTKFTPEIQDKMFIYQIKKISKDSKSQSEMVERLRKQWGVLKSASASDIQKMVDEVNKL